jgi:hypothetical protein
MVQGTVNGLGERCGNANLCSVAPTLALKMGSKLNVPDLSHLTALSTFVSETANVTADPKLPYVGKSAFAHKAGIHVNAMMKDEKSYEHIDPAVVGNERRVLTYVPSAPAGWQVEPARAPVSVAPGERAVVPVRFTPAVGVDTSAVRLKTPPNHQVER